MSRARKGVGIGLLAAVHCVDNSGASTLKHIGMFHRKLTKVGQKMTVSVTGIKKIPGIPKTKVKQGEVRHAVLLTTRAPIMRKCGVNLRFGRNTACLVDLNNKKNAPLGDVISGPVAREVERTGLWSKLLDAHKAGKLC
eukprot:NODE_4827_length_755_cov_64.807365_g4475_i0.p2 GENE.NODE_4827_length_755_cov_64.807365_g4475_i0~~NODE_4827_length_755_cov_64.807365_g4475_i0.p2  ORF type:complete len:139 (+),score=22.55 NODE_4827_length_755_cov_64.807365_g4475_i0:169-585(+)